jgi:hypothetical protein
LIFSPTPPTQYVAASLYHDRFSHIVAESTVGGEEGRQKDAGGSGGCELTLASPLAIVVFIVDAICLALAFAIALALPFDLDLALVLVLFLSCGATAHQLEPAKSRTYTQRGISLSSRRRGL